MEEIKMENINLNAIMDDLRNGMKFYGNLAWSHLCIGNSCEGFNCNNCSMREGRAYAIIENNNLIGCRLVRQISDDESEVVECRFM